VELGRGGARAVREVAALAERVAAGRPRLARLLAEREREPVVALRLARRAPLTPLAELDLLLGELAARDARLVLDAKADRPHRAEQGVDPARAGGRRVEVEIGGGGGLPRR